MVYFRKGVFYRCGPERRQMEKLAGCRTAFAQLFLLKMKWALSDNMNEEFSPRSLICGCLSIVLTDFVKTSIFNHCNSVENEKKKKPLEWFWICILPRDNWKKIPLHLKIVQIKEVKYIGLLSSIITLTCPNHFSYIDWKQIVKNKIFLFSKHLLPRVRNFQSCI